MFRSRNNAGREMLVRDSLARSFRIRVMRYALKEDDKFLMRLARRELSVTRILDNEVTYHNRGPISANLKNRLSEEC